MKKYILLLGVLLNFQANAQGGWEKLITPTNQNLNEIMFVDDQIGFACGDSGILLKTSNAGDTWQILNTPSNENIRSVAFTTELHGGIIIGPFNGQTSFYVTNDGGISWDAKWPGFGGFCFPNVVYAVEDKILIGGNGCFYGDALSVYQNDTIVMDTMIHIFNMIENFDFITDDIGFACSNRERMYKTLNGGLSWEHINYPTELIKVEDIAFINEDTGYIVGTDTSNAGPLYPSVLFKTIDGGANWQDAIGILFVTPKFTDVTYYAEDSVIAVGNYDTQWNGNGTVWFNFYDSTSVWFNEWWAADTANNKVSKNDVVSNFGCIYMVGDSGFIAKNCIDTNFSIGSFIEELSLDFDLNLFPNPSQNMVCLEANDVKEGVYQLQIYNALGWLIFNQSFNQKADKIKAEMNISTFSNGLYYLKLSKGKESIVKSFLKN